MTHKTRPPSSRPRTAAERKAKSQKSRQATLSRYRRRRSALVAAGVVSAAAIAALVAVLVVGGSDKPAAVAGGNQIMPSAVTGARTVELTPNTAADTSGISGVLAWDTTGYPGDGSSHPGAVEHQHVTGRVAYAITPPVGGPHAAVMMNAGVYTAPVPTERAVHDLEHGAVWITYRPDLAAATVATLTAMVAAETLLPEPAQATGVSGQTNRFVVMSPWPGSDLPSPIVISAWGHQLRVSDPADPRLPRFIATFRDTRAYSPEYGEAVDGIPVQTGGRAASSGGGRPNPAGSLTP